jgi:hypothetical protein
MPRWAVAPHRGAGVQPGANARGRVFDHQAAGRVGAQVGSRKNVGAGAWRSAR